MLISSIKKFSLDTPYLLPRKFHNFLDNSSDQFSVLHLNIKSIKKTLKTVFKFDKFYFQCETCWDDLATIEKSLFELLNYNSTHQGRGDRKGSGVSIYIHKSLDFTVKPYLSLNNNDIESLTIEILSDKKETL